MKNQLKVYVACALTYVPSDQKILFTSLLNEVKVELRGKGFVVIDFLSSIKENPESKEVYNFDLKCLKDADCMLALGDYPGTGLGYEICYTTELRKIPTIVGVRNSDNISKLLRGVSQDNYQLSVFDKPHELIESFISFVNKFYEKSN